MFSCSYCSLGFTFLYCLPSEEREIHRGFDTLFCTAALWIGRKPLKLSANVHGQLGSHPSLHRTFEYSPVWEGCCGTTLKAASMHKPPVTYNQSTSVPQQILYTTLVFQPLKFSFNSDI